MMSAPENRTRRDGAIHEAAVPFCLRRIVSDITWIEAFWLLLETFLEDDEIESLLEAFVAVIPAQLRNKLLQCA
jgi:hypothetical protein